MGKKKDTSPLNPPSMPVQPQAPKFMGSTIKLNGMDTIKTHTDDGGNLIFDVMQDPTSKALLQGRLGQLADYEKNVNVFDPSLTNQWDSMYNDYRNKNLEDFNDINTKQNQALMENVGRRFGNIDTSIYNDKQGDLQKWANESVQDINREANLYRTDLQDNELARRYQYLQQLQGGIDQERANQQSNIAQTLQGAGLINNFNQGNFGTNANMYDTNANLYSTNLNNYNQKLAQR
ncbi:MAG: hypothetical protein RLY43_1353, partial [Bacteroidota bacterium]